MTTREYFKRLLLADLLSPSLFPIKESEIDNSIFISILFTLDRSAHSLLGRSEHQHRIKHLPFK